jgi:hypothetical protein
MLEKGEKDRDFSAVETASPERNSNSHLTFTRHIYSTDFACHDDPRRRQSENVVSREFIAQG